MARVITDRLLEDYLKCHSKAYLRVHGRAGDAQDYLALCSRLDARHRASASQRLSQTTTDGVSHFGGALLQDMTTTHAIILDAVGVADGLETRFHALQRTPDDSQLGAYHYQPVRFYRQLQPNVSIHLLLAFDALILGHLQGVSPEVGVLLCGPMFRRINIRLQTHLDSLAIVQTKLRAQCAGDNEPPLVLNRHCDICEFKQLCRAKAIEEDNLTLLRGMTLKEMRGHNSRGIFSVNQLSYTFRSRRPAKRQKQQFHHNFALQALALREKKVHVHNDPILLLPRTQAYLDIEGLPDRGIYYLIGVLLVMGDSEQYHCFWANDESGQPTIFAQLSALLAENADCKIFHYGNFELKALRRMLLSVPENCCQSLRAALANSTNILSIVSSHVYFPTTSNSLKEVAGFLGFRWTVAEASGLDSIVWREQWEDTHDDSLKAKLLDYNRDDCSALRAVTEFIASIASYEEKRDTHSNPAKIVHTADLQTVIRKHRFGRQEFCLPDLKFVNNCAYFNYQRDKVSVRTSKRLLSTSLSCPPKRRHHAKVNKRIDVRCKRCVHCNSRRLSEGRTLSRRTVDMKFFGGGIKKWVTVYSSRKYRCDKCGKTFMPRNILRLEISMAMA